MKIDFSNLKFDEKGLIPAGMIPKEYRSFLTKDLLKEFVGEGVMISPSISLSMDSNLLCWLLYSGTNSFMA